MSDLSVTATDVAIVESPRLLRTYPAGAPVDAGAPVYLDANGYVQEADANGSEIAKLPIGLAITSAGSVTMPVTVAGPDALVDLGDALGGLAYGAAVYLSDTAGALADADATGSAAVMGAVVPAFASTTADKLLRISGALTG